MTTFTYNNIEYTVSDSGYYFKTVNGKKSRISLKAFEAARNTAVAESESKMDEAMDRKVEEAHSKKEAMDRALARMNHEQNMNNEFVNITKEDLEKAIDDENVTPEQFDDMLAEAELAQTIAEYEESCIDEEKVEILKEMEEEADRQTEATFNGTAKEETPKEAKPKKARKPRRSKDSKEFEVDGQKISLTPKQIDFIQHLPDTCFWENGLDSCIWVDCLCDDIGGQFADKPMTVGAMISTLCEKGLGDRVAERRDGKKCTSFELTETGKAIAEMLGVH